MPLNRYESKSLLRGKIGEAEESINSIETEMVKSDDQFRKHMLSFHFGRLQQQFQEIHSILKDAEWI